MKFPETLEELHALHRVPGAASPRNQAPRITPEYHRIIEAALTAGEVGGARCDAERPERAAQAMR